MEDDEHDQRRNATLEVGGANSPNNLITQNHLYVLHCLRVPIAFISRGLGVGRRSELHCGSVDDCSERGFVFGRTRVLG